MGHEGITQLLQRWSTGDPEAAEKAIARVYDELHQIACRHLRRERDDHTLQATAIVNEAWLRLNGSEGLSWPSRAHFFAFASKLIRRILVDHSRNRNRAKRGGQWDRVDLDMVADQIPERAPDLLALDQALSDLEAVDPRKAAVVELRFFGGLTLDEIGEQLGISVETAGREWRRARAWLYKELGSAEVRL